MSKTQVNPQDQIRADDLLMKGEVEVLVCSFHSDHRPIQGTAALVDWRLKGMISRFIKSGNITGEKNETVYIPVYNEHRPEDTRSAGVILVGAGRSDVPLLPTENKALLETVRARLLKLKKRKVAVSTSSFESMDAAQIRKVLDGFDVVLAP